MRHFIPAATQPCECQKETPVYRLWMDAQYSPDDEIDWSENYAEEVQPQTYLFRTSVSVVD